MYIFCADIIRFHDNHNHNNCRHNYSKSKFFEKREDVEKYVANVLYNNIEKLLDVADYFYKELAASNRLDIYYDGSIGFTGLKDPKLYESKYVHDFKIIGDIKNDLDIMDELKELYLKGETVDYIIDYDIESVEVY